MEPDAEAELYVEAAVGEPNAALDVVQLDLVRLLPSAETSHHHPPSPWVEDDVEGEAVELDEMPQVGAQEALPSCHPFHHQRAQYRA